MSKTSSFFAEEIQRLETNINRVEPKGANRLESAFKMFSTVHISSMITLCLLILLLFLIRNRWSIQQQKVQFIERFFTLTLLIMDVFIIYGLFNQEDGTLGTHCH